VGRPTEGGGEHTEEHGEASTAEPVTGAEATVRGDRDRPADDQGDHPRHESREVPFLSDTQV
jgi:hypothetical protein